MIINLYCVDKNLMRFYLETTKQLYDLNYTLIDEYISELNEKVQALKSVKEAIESGLEEEKVL